MFEGGLTEHLSDAIRLNRALRAGYAAAGGPWAAWLSRTLVALERGLLPAARVLDRQAAPFWAEGVPVVRGDLASMRDVPSASAEVGRVVGDAAPARRLAHRVVRVAVRGARDAQRRGDTARPVHARGAGLFVNDVPPVPG